MLSKIAVTLVSAICLVSPIRAQPVLPQPAATPPPFIAPPEPESPHKALAEFVQALNQSNWTAASKRVLGGKTGEELKPITEDLKATYGNWRLQIDQRLHTNGQETDFAIFKIRLRLQDKIGNRISHEERVNLQFDNKLWKIVPLTPEDTYQPFSSTLDSEILENIATCLHTPQFINQNNQISCMTNLKQLGLAAAQFVQDWDEKYALKTSAFADYLRPYFHNDDILVCPVQPNEKIGYAFNSNLENITLLQMQQPDKTVLIYEGKDGQLDFRHDNRAGACFADGHVQMVTPEEAKTLKWQP